MESIHTMNSVQMLDPNATLFKILKDNPPAWWSKLVNDPEIYIEIRKGNKIHAYYYGARIAEIIYDNGRIDAKCHTKYIYGEKDSNNTYASCINLLDNNLEQLKENARECYVKEDEGEDTSEKRVQGRIRIDNVHRYIDSEFEHSYSGVGNRSTMIRFDLVAVDGNEIKIEELKRIGDNRMRTSDMVSTPPEILDQMERYSKFMSVNKNALISYYEVLISIKTQLGLPTPVGYDKNKPLTLDMRPLLLIKNLYQYKKMNAARFERIKDIRDILEKNNVKYYIMP